MNACVKVGSTSWEAKDMHDVYWHPHIDKNNTEHYDYRPAAHTVGITHVLTRLTQCAAGCSAVGSFTWLTMKTNSRYCFYCKIPSSYPPNGGEVLLTC